MPAFDAVDGSSTGHVSAMDMGATKAPMIRRIYLCKQLRCRRSVRHLNGIFRQQTKQIAAAILAQCGTWKMWVDDNLCTLHGSNPGVTAGMSCGLYVRGDQGCASRRPWPVETRPRHRKCAHRALRIDNHFPVMLGFRPPT